VDYPRAGSLGASLQASSLKIVVWTND